MSLTPPQSRSARGWLGWTQSDLAAKAQVGLSTLRDFESGTRTPIQNNVAAIRRALEDGGAGPFLVATDAFTPPPTQTRESAPGKRQESGGGERRAKPSRRSVRGR